MKNKEPKDKTAPETESRSEPVCEEASAAGAPQSEPPEDGMTAQLKKEFTELNEKYVRVLAEYDNFRKRTQREKEALWADATAAAVTKMLPILDNFERSAAFETTDAAYKKGIDLIGAAFKETLEKLEVKEIPATGETFDPNFHNAVAHIDNDELGENVVADCFQKGYMIGDRVIRHSMVQVAN